MPWSQMPAQHPDERHGQAGTWFYPHTPREMTVRILYHPDGRVTAGYYFDDQKRLDLLSRISGTWALTPNEHALWAKACQGDAQAWAVDLDPPDGISLLERVYRQAPKRMHKLLIEGMTVAGARWDAVNAEGIPVWQTLA